MTHSPLWVTHATAKSKAKNIFPTPNKINNKNEWKYAKVNNNGSRRAAFVIIHSCHRFVQIL